MGKIHTLGTQFPNLEKTISEEGKVLIEIKQTKEGHIGIFPLVDDLKNPANLYKFLDNLANELFSDVTAQKAAYLLEQHQKQAVAAMQNEAIAQAVKNGKIKPQ